MDQAALFLRSFTIVLGVAAVVTILFQRLRWPVVLGYILAGLLVGPHVPFSLVADPQVVQILSELGVILLMFVLGLEFSLSKLVRVAPTAGVTALLQCGVMTWVGFLVGRMLGWTPLESIFTGAIVAISSTTIIAKVFDERGIGGKLRELVLGILLIEDLIGVVMMAALTAIATGAGLTAGALAGTVGRLALFLAILVGVGFLIVPRLIRLVLKQGRNETIVVTSIALCFGTAYLANAAGYSVALGAFLAGSLVAESGRSAEIEHLVEPVRDLFAAVFFVSVGLTFDPVLVVQHWGAVVVLSLVVITGQMLSVTVGSFLTGAGARTSIQAGMAVTQIGEFSFIIAGLGLTLGATREFLYPVTVAVSAVTTLTTPFLIASSDKVAALVDRKLPHAFQTYGALYGAWLEKLSTGRYRRRSVGGWRVARLLLLDTIALTALVIGVSLGAERVVMLMTDALGVGIPVAGTLATILVAALAVPLIIGIGRLAGRLGRLLAITALPKARRGVDFDHAPRQSLEVTLQITVVLVVTVVILAISQPFLPSYAGPVLFLVLLAAFGVALWRSAADLDSHVRAGSEAVVSALKSYALSEPTGEMRAITNVQHLMPGLGATVAVQLTRASRGVGRSLAELDLRGRTGATVLAIRREGASIPNPEATERLRESDVLALTGTADALDAARAALVE
ncbi:MAG: cation:proton antiporter [Gemmatimonadota bacterium]